LLNHSSHRAHYAIRRHLTCSGHLLALEVSSILAIVIQWNMGFISHLSIFPPFQEDCDIGKQNQMIACNGSECDLCLPLRETRCASEMMKEVAAGRGVRDVQRYRFSIHVNQDKRHLLAVGRSRINTEIIITVCHVDLNGVGTKGGPGTNQTNVRSSQQY
jgi:hypothetical protein